MSPTPRIPERILWTVEVLDVQPMEHLLEIGCGPGHAVSLVCARLKRGTITAIDRSATMAARARDRNQAHFAAGRARIEQCTLADLDVGRRRFDKIFAVNVNAFWTAPTPSLEHLRRLLHHSGRAYLVYEPPSATRLRELQNRLPELLQQHAFHVEDLRVRAFRASQGLCIIGRPV